MFGHSLNIVPRSGAPKQAAHSKDRTCPKVLHKGHSRIENSTLQEQTSKTRLQTLEHRRLIHDLCLCHKILHEFIHCTIPKFPVFMSSRTRGHTLRLRQEKCSTTHRLHFLINRIVKPWNSLPPDIISSTTHNRFKVCISNTDLTKYLTI